MTDEQCKRIHDITYSTDDREELAERIVKLEDERDLYSSLVEDMDHPDVANQLRAENAKLQDENARLRSCLSDDAENARLIMGENAKLRKLLSNALIAAGYQGRQFLDEYLRGEEETTLLDELRAVGIEVNG